MTESMKNSFLTKVALQAETNRLVKGEQDLPMEKWAMIAGEHMGHLFAAVMDGDRDRVEKELLHVTAPLLELYQGMMTTDSYPSK
ncbi:hypothetical protein Dred_0985 [Desulforamulus reducens MI-1]|uniref:Uncharacterized protein n=1 Tax=Desulforamulus reducens (strain ATCC BAA-1160 / DSM 100696 / MI-1) TaxID=349161 RepID=A4J367_DESRM|nr:hypothetical protein [Desulforamulus reducens]ABO49520.1 hypothetical protein Dred_0985 [Desulforamulus reducens MI-1]